MGKRRSSQPLVSPKIGAECGCVSPMRPGSFVRHSALGCCGTDRTVKLEDDGSACALRYKSLRILLRCPCRSASRAKPARCLSHLCGATMYDLPPSVVNSRPSLRLQNHPDQSLITHYQFSLPSDGFLLSEQLALRYFRVISAIIVSRRDIWI